MIITATAANTTVALTYAPGIRYPNDPCIIERNIADTHVIHDDIAKATSTSLFAFSKYVIENIANRAKAPNIPGVPILFI